MNSIPYVYVTVKSHLKAQSVRLADKSEELVREAGADSRAMVALQRRLPPYVQKLLTGSYSTAYAFFNGRFPNIGSGTFAVPVYAIGVDGQRREVWPEIHQKVEEFRERHEAGILKAAELLATGQVLDMAKEFSGKAYKGEILPQSEAMLREWYRLEILVDVKPSPEYTAWLENVGQVEREKLESDVEKSRAITEATERAALREPLMDGIRDLLESVIEKADKKGTHWKTIAEKVERIVTILPAFNIDHDPKINQILLDIADKFKVVKVQGDALREKENPARKELVTEAKRIAKAFAGL